MRLAILGPSLAVVMRDARSKPRFAQYAFVGRIVIKCWYARGRFHAELWNTVGMPMPEAIAKGSVRHVLRVMLKWRDAEVARMLAEPRCRTCDDTPSSPERPCPRPSPGRPYVDCGRGGHMFDRRIA